MTFHYRYRKQIIIVTFVVLILISIAGTTIYFYEPKEKKTISSVKVKKEATATTAESNSPDEDQEKYMIDIKGEVANPGIYELESTSRVIDVINAAGGLTQNADTTVINLSKKIEDEMVIIIYSKKEVTNWLETKEQESYLQEKCIEPQEGQVKNDACISDTKESSSSTTPQTPSIVNINTATKDQLMTLNGIGEAKADSIIAYREQTPFTTIEDIKNVSGIGDSIYEQIKDFITV